jgi:protein TonB
MLLDQDANEQPGPAVQLQAAQRRRWSAALLTSAVGHSVLLVILCWPAAPVFVKPFLLAQGQGGTYTPASVTLYLAQPKTRAATVQSTSLSLPASQRKAQEKRNLQKRSNVLENVKPVDTVQAGSIHGSALDGPSEGDEITPGFAISFTEPRISRSDLPSGMQGEVIVEIVVDADGKVIEEKLIQGMGHGVDEKVIAAIQGWHFQPATRNGIPIPSRRDVLYHFPN